ncbi:MAG: V-type ATP synthase subunit F [Myxococcota bacterium]|nr:V-type ATP synthase subunit F [Myxococcota bacterium]
MNAPEPGAPEQPLPPGAAWALGDGATVRAFRLAGLRGAVVESPAAARAMIERLRSEGAALVVVTEALAAALEGDGTPVGAGVQPLVVAVPAPAGPGAATTPSERLASAVRSALGLAVGQRAPR